MDTFAELKSKVIQYFDTCIAFVEKYDFERHVEKLRTGRTKIAENQISIVAVGEARRGKSSLLSAFLEDKGLFPVDVSVTTCLATAVRYGKTEKITVTLENEQKVEISRKEIPLYASEKYNTNNARKAKWIEIETPNAKLKEGITVVDTPGVGSLNPKHTEVTYSFLPRADIVLFVSDATAELTQPELSFLKSVRKYCNNFLFVLTKKDLSMDYEAVMQGNKKRISEYAEIPQDTLRYVPVASTIKLSALERDSARMHAASNFAALHAEIMRMVDENRAGMILTPPLVDLSAVMQEIGNELHIRETGLGGTTEEQSRLREKLRKLQEERQELLAESASWQADMQHEITQIGSARKQKITDFGTEARKLLQELLAQPQYLRQPQTIVNEIVQKACITSHDIDDAIYSRLCGLLASFEEEHGIKFLKDTVEHGELAVEEEPVIVFQKKGLIEKGRRISGHSIGASAIGSLAGLAIGAIVGVSTGGIGWAVMQSGMSIGSLTAGLFGSAKGALSVMKNPGEEDIPEIRSKVMEYINGTVANWQSEHVDYMENVRYNFIKNLRESVRESQKQLEADMAALQNNSILNPEKRADGQKMLKEAKREYAEIASEFTEIKNREKQITAEAVAKRNKEIAEATAKAKAEEALRIAGMKQAADVRRAEGVRQQESGEPKKSRLKINFGSKKPTSQEKKEAEPAKVVAPKETQGAFNHLEDW